MIRFGCWVLILLLSSGAGAPFRIVAAPSANCAPTPTEEDECGEAIKVAPPSDRQRSDRIRNTDRIATGRSATDRNQPCGQNALARSASTAFLIAVNSPILC